MNEKESSLNSFNETKGSINWNDKATKVLVILSSIFIALQIISNTVAGKSILWFSNGNGFEIYCAAGAILFPFVSLISDSISNVFGTKIVKTITKLSMLVNIIFAIICTIVIAWPSPSFFANSDAYATVLTQSGIMVIAGILALYCSSIVNSLVLQALKRKQVQKNESTLDSRGIFIRSVVSSLPSVALDSFLFNFISFIWFMTIPQIMVMFITQFCVKIIIEIIIQIFVSRWTVPYLVNYTGIDVVEDKQKFI